MNIPILGMDELAAKSPTLGNKVKNLAVLTQKGVRVPRGFGLPYEVYVSHITVLKPAMQQAREQADSYADMSRRLQEVILSAPFGGSSNVLRALDEHMPGATHFAVRSSGAPVISGKQAVEDSAELSLAGQFESFLLVPAHNVPDVILLCYASLFSERCLRQFNVMEDASYLNSRMSVLVQEMYQADLSAVVMTRDPVEGGDNFGIEITYGACEALVSGELQGDLYLLSRTTGDVLDKQLGTKNAYIKHEPLVDLKADNKKSHPLPDDMRNSYAASQGLIDEIYSLGMRIESYYNAPQDIELVVVDNEIIVVQTRPITAGK